MALDARDAPATAAGLPVCCVITTRCMRQVGDKTSRSEISALHRAWPEAPKMLNKTKSALIEQINRRRDRQVESSWYLVEPIRPFSGDLFNFSRFGCAWLTENTLHQNGNTKTSGMFSVHHVHARSAGWLCQAVRRSVRRRGAF